MSTTSTQNNYGLIPLAQQIIQKRANFVAKQLVSLGFGETTARVFSKNYQNPILTTAEPLSDFVGQGYHSYAGTGGYGCYGPPNRVPQPGGDYPYSLDAMWIRDACAQYHAYLGIFSHPELNGPDHSPEEVNALGTFIEGLIRTCCLFLNDNITVHAFDRNGKPDRVGKKFEPDSLAYVIFLATDYEKASGSTGHLDTHFWETMNKIVETLSKPIYLFTLRDPGDHLALVHASTRPSDDEMLRNFNIPVNAFIAAMMRRLIALATHHKVTNFDVDKATILSDNIRYAIITLEIGVFDHPSYGRIYAFETDAGLEPIKPLTGEQTTRDPIFMDDAGIPSLISLPYLGFCSDNYDPTAYDIYLNTRIFLLSAGNPFYFESRNGNYKGNGSPHTESVCYINDPNNPQRIQCYGFGDQQRGIWPMAIIMQGMTHTTGTEETNCLEILVTSTQKEGGNSVYFCNYYSKEHPIPWYKEHYPNKDYMRESFEANDPQKITRGWFAWVDALFGEWLDRWVSNNTLEDGIAGE